MSGNAILIRVLLVGSSPRSISISIKGIIALLDCLLSPTREVDARCDFKILILRVFKVLKLLSE